MNSKRKNPNRPRPNQIRIEGVESSTRQLIFIYVLVYMAKIQQENERRKRQFKRNESRKASERRFNKWFYLFQQTEGGFRPATMSYRVNIIFP